MNANRIIASLEKKLSQDVGYRVDLHLADARRINKTVAHFMVGFDGETPTADDIQEWFIRKFDAKMLPNMSTARVYDSQKVVTVVAQLHSITREVGDIKRRGMVPVIAGTTYLDVALDETWEVRDGGNGEKVLYRKNKDDIMALVQARRDAMLDSGKKTFASVAQGSNMLKFLAILSKGDDVKVYCDGKIMDAEILAADEAKVKVKLASGKVEELPRGNVIEVVNSGAAKEKAMKEQAEEYFSQAYGDPDYAKALVK